MHHRDGWLTVREAAARAGVSESKVKRDIAELKDPSLVYFGPTKVGGKKQRWLIEPIDGLRQIKASGRDRAETAPAKRDGEGVEAQWVRFEKLLEAQSLRIDRLLGATLDEVQAARTSALEEQALANELVAVVRAQLEAATARREAETLLQQALSAFGRAAIQDAAAAEALVAVVERRSSQLGELLAPGSLASLMSQAGADERQPVTPAPQRPPGR